MHVVAGVLVDEQGRILIAQRPAGKHLAGMWEFPGGKLESGESAVVALERELDEELGIRVDPASFEACIRVPWRYGERSMLLEAMLVRGWTGRPQALDAAAIAWHPPQDIDPAILAPADRPILAAVRLPARYVTIAPEATPAATADVVRATLARGERLLRLRTTGGEPDVVREAAASVLAEIQACGATLLLDRDIAGALALGIGVHLAPAQLRGLTERPLPSTLAVGASCHDADDLERASAVGCDFATLSPVLPSRDRPDAEPLGWPRFARLTEAASLPVYAGGGVGPDELAEARMHAAQGVAGAFGTG
ncbi:8-oxo-dGTP diphosphatase [Luteibacter sp. UNCMF331Sha3.1]|uniref:Nudix family hydrolase n=1 Tax=Luteibacter sp. UNCMF331Sha3.1 TaxID=1502760 RepID=UPI0008BD9916|nr:Nudix family hydrolase [Luteibacter sp. UNCMF331Sha3.1]SEM25143.1 8-oxo-dGTP diphosphatase [Luteibacter sp. UNCMF331Sha3.1]